MSSPLCSVQLRRLRSQNNAFLEQGSRRLHIIHPTGHTLRPILIEFKRRLHRKVKIIPIIAKSDTFTDEEIVQLKQCVFEDIADHHIDVATPSTTTRTRRPINKADRYTGTDQTVFDLRPLRQRGLSTMSVVPAGCCSTIQPDHHAGDKHSSSDSASDEDPDARFLESAANQAQGRLAKYEVLALEAGIVFHSIIIGVSIGTSSGSGWEFCEGLALASRIAILPTTRLLTKLLMYAAFVLTTPVGVSIRIGVRQS
ncbi:hypothetical protein CF327_g194 [Tilletia walkeri]|nr:hypothetical protein CF327_g194 [Tilletia walkeri]